VENRPILAITMGDPAGIGPEIVLKALAGEELYGVCRPLVIGASGVLRRAQKLVAAPPGLNVVAGPEEGRFQSGTLDLVDMANVEVEELAWGQLSAMAGRASVEYVLEAVRLVLSGRVQGIATGPISKEAINLANYPYIGHTELLADVTQAPRVTTMLASGPLRVVHVTRHIALRDVAAQVKRHRVVETIEIAHQGLKEMGFLTPRIAVAALNPHRGEGGLLGDEEMEEIGPAVEIARQAGIEVRGPFSADVVFHQALQGEFDVVVAMYHDQGHIPIKTYGFEKSITITLGLPIIRTSVDHGTAFDIAGRGLASPNSLIEAIKAAAEIARRKRLASA